MISHLKVSEESGGLFGWGSLFIFVEVVIAISQEYLGIILIWRVWEKFVYQKEEQNEL